ncbi:hypothetical protein RND81_12G155900 [Saponaria officinalis]|uniref:C2 domain-containing protein n=1 Tax=Saponaria officinalis TaxID=3572 RepID=A0AAW1HB30_SAPOF
MIEPSHVLQINIISASNLAPVSRSMSTYAVGWINPERKQTTRTDNTGNTSPVWNDEFVFRVTPNFLKSEATNFVIEIYAQAWIRDVMVGSVKVSIASLVPTPNPKGTARRAVALQIRRPSGRPQGILNVSVSIMDGTMKSMPLDGPVDDGPQLGPGSVRGELRRVQSDLSWIVPDYESRRSRLTHGPETRPCSSLGGSWCNSDIGPSPSVVAAAMAKGLYVPPKLAEAAAASDANDDGRRGRQNEDGENSIIEWADEKNEEDVMSKLERWRTELNQPKRQGKEKEKGSNGLSTRQKRRHRRTKTEVGKLFKCFGKAYGIEFTIVCGGNQLLKNAKTNSGKKRPLLLSDDESHIIV